MIVEAEIRDQGSEIGSVLICLIAAILLYCSIGVMAADRMGAKHKITRWNGSLASKGQTPIFHEQVNGKCGLVVTGARFVSVIYAANKSDGHEVYWPCSLRQFPNVGIKIVARDGYRCLLGNRATWKQDISERTHPDWGGSIITDALLRLTQIIPKKSWRQHSNYRNILCWGSPNIRNNESEIYSRRFAIVSQGGCDKNIHINPWAISVSHYLQLSLHRSELVRCGSTCHSGIDSCLRQLSLGRYPLLVNFRELLHDFAKLALHHLQLPVVNANGDYPNYVHQSSKGELPPFNSPSTVDKLFSFTYVLFGWLCFIFVQYALVKRFDWCWWGRVVASISGGIIGIVSIVHACHLFGIS